MQLRISAAQSEASGSQRAGAASIGIDELAGPCRGRQLREREERGERARHETERDPVPDTIVRLAAQTPPLAKRDYVHLTSPGYEALGDALLESLMVSYGAAELP